MTQPEDLKAKIALVIEQNTRRGRNGAYVEDIPKLASAILAMLAAAPGVGGGG